MPGPCAAALAAALGAIFVAARAQVLDGLFVAVLMLIAAYGYGRALGSRLDLDHDLGTWRSVPMLTALGWAILLTIGLVAGSLGALTRPVVFVACFGGIAAAVLSAGTASQQTATAQPRPVPSPVWWWGLVVILLVGLAGAVSPDVRYDALAIHLPIAREFAVRHAIVEMSHNAASYHTLHADLLYAMAMVVRPGESAPKLLHYAAGALACLLLYDLGTRLWDGRVGLAAAATVAGTPLILRLSGTANTDLWLVLFAAAAARCFHLYLSRPGAPRAMAVGLFAGALVGTKATGVIVAAPLTAVLLLTLVFGRGLARRTGMALAAMAGAALTGAYWYVRAWLLTDNPFFPLLSQVFGGRYARSGPYTYFDGYGMGAAPWDLLLLPWRMAWFPARFSEDAGGGIGLVYLILAPFALLAVARRRAPWWLVGAGVAGGLLWFSTAQYARFLAPVLPFAALIGAAGVFAAGLPPRVLRVSAAIVVAGIGVGVFRWAAAGPPNFPLALLAGGTTREAYMAAHLQGFPVARFAAHHLPPSARIYGAGEDLGYYYERFFVPSSWHGRIFHPSLRLRILGVRTGAELRTVLAEAGFTHVVRNANRRWYLPHRWPQSWVEREAFWEEGPRLLYAYGEVYLYDLSDVAPRVRGPELLVNPAMDPGPDGLPHGWQASGTVRLATAPDEQGKVRIASGGYLVQQVPVRPEALYALEAVILSVQPVGTARFFIQWMDQDGRPLDYTTWRRMDVGQNAKRHAMVCAAHPGARTAQVWLIADQGDIEFDRAGFYELR